MPNQVKSLNRSVSKQTTGKSDNNALLKGEVNNFSRYPLGGIFFVLFKRNFTMCAAMLVTLLSGFYSLKNFSKKEKNSYFHGQSVLHTELEEFICVWVSSI